MNEKLKLHVREISCLQNFAADPPIKFLQRFMLNRHWNQLYHFAVDICPMQIMVKFLRQTIHVRLILQRQLAVNIYPPLKGDIPFFTYI